MALKTYMEARLRAHSEEIMAAMKAHVSRECEKVETKLLTEFHKWASPFEARARSHSAALRAMDPELEALSERVTRLEPNRLEPKAIALTAPRRQVIPYPFSACSVQGSGSTHPCAAALKTRRENMRKLLTTMYWLALALVLPTDRLGAQAYAPPVTMSVKLPDGQTQDLTVPESGLGKVTLKDGREFGFRPTLWDDKGTRVTVTIFRIGSPDVEMAQIESGVGKPAAESKAAPGFSVKVTKVAGNAS